MPQTSDELSLTSLTHEYLDRALREEVNELLGGGYGTEGEIELYVLDDDTASREVELFTRHGVIIVEVALEIHGDVLEGADPDRVIKINLPSGRCLYVIGIKDIILDRLRACIHWRSSSDCERDFTCSKCIMHPWTPSTW